MPTAGVWSGPPSDAIKVGAFRCRPGPGGFARADVLPMERRPTRSGVHTMRIGTRDKPALVGIDPCDGRAVRNGDDKVVPVG